MISEINSVDTILSWIQANHAYAVAIVFLLGFAESVVLIAILVPSTVLLAGLGSTYAAAGGSILSLWFAGAIGATAGDAVSFALGRYFREDIAKFWPFRRYPGVMDQATDVFRRWGWSAILLSKFTFGVRPFVPVTAGVLAMPLVSFLAASALSCIMWAGAALGLGFGLVQVAERLWGA